MINQLLLINNNTMKYLVLKIALTVKYLKFKTNSKILVF